MKSARKILKETFLGVIDFNERAAVEAMKKYALRYYNYHKKKDLVKFGEYLLSDERKKLIEDSYYQGILDGIENPLPIEDSLKLVHDSDLQNWFHQIALKKQKKSAGKV